MTVEVSERRERTGKGRHATQSEKKAFAAGAIINKGPAAAQVKEWPFWSSLATDYWSASHSFVEPGHSCSLEVCDGQLTGKIC